MKTFRASFVSLFPESIRGIVSSSILGRALDAGILSVEEEQIRDHSPDRFKRVDDTPYGGGAGQVIRVDYVVSALRACIERAHPVKPHIILTDAAGKKFTSADAKRIASYEQVIFVCGRYEGIDARIHNYVDEAFCIGDFINTGGELAALAMYDAIARHVPGVLGNDDSHTCESFEHGLLEYRQYTRPPVFEGHVVPDIYLSGHHAHIAQHRLREQQERTQLVRPDLVSKE